MVLGVLLIFIAVVIEGARYQTIRLKAECVTDAGMNGIFAEYHRELVRKYGLLYIDDSYGGNGNLDMTKQHLLGFIKLNCMNEAGLELTGLKVDNAEIDDISYASDRGGEVLRYQIYKYMKQNSQIRKDFNHISMSDIEDYDNYSNRREEVSEIIDEIVAEYNRKLPKYEEPVSISNPADAVEYLSQNNVILYAFNDLSSLSTKIADVDGLISRRGYRDGYGLYAEQTVSENLSEESYMNYVFDRLGYCNQTKADCCLDYQIEYMIANGDSDLENIGLTLEKIFKSRYLTNYHHIENCGAKQEEAQLLAETVSSVIGTQELINAVKESIILAWAYAESAKDIRILMDGNNLSATKTDESWNTSLGDIAGYKSDIGSYSVTGGELDYADYLYSLLKEETVVSQNMKLMDVMEMDMRITPGNQRFRMDNQIYQLTATVNYSGAGGRGVQITRKKSFW